MIYCSTLVTEIGEEVPDLLEGGILILYADGAPPALAEVSIQHVVDEPASAATPPVGARVSLGDVSGRISAVGTSAWAKVRELGHVVLNFNGATQTDRPGEICVERCDLAALLRETRSGNTLVIAD